MSKNFYELDNKITVQRAPLFTRVDIDPTTF